MTPLAGFLIIGGGLAGLLLAIGTCQRRWRMHPELARKLFHLGGGLAGLSLPWLFARVWPVLTLTAIVSAALITLRRVPPLRTGVGRVLAGINRFSLGELCFPVSVCILYLACREDILLYSVPILILTFADAGAALVGIRYGSRHYRTLDGVKTLEGSATFFLLAFLSIYLPILLWSGEGGAAPALIALAVSLLITLVEAVSWAGLDNLFVPVTSFLVLRALL